MPSKVGNYRDSEHIPFLLLISLFLPLPWIPVPSPRSGLWAPYCVLEFLQGPRVLEHLLEGT